MRRSPRPTELAFWAVVRHELGRIGQSRVMRAAAVLVGALLLVAFLLEAHRFRAAVDERSVLQQKVLTAWQDQPDRHPHRVSHYGFFAFRPPGPLGFFDPGVESFLGTSVFLEPHRRNPISFSEATEASELLRFGTTSAAFVLQFVLPLLIFFLAFPSIAGEREAGTWRLVLSQGIPVPVVVTGKIVGILLAVSLVVVPICALALLAAVLGGILVPSADTAARIALLALGYGVYFWGCAALAVLVSYVHHRSHDALMTLLGLFIALWVVTPRVVAETAVRTYPVPSRGALEAALQRSLQTAGDSHNPNDPHFQALRQKTLAQYGVERVEDLPINYGGLVMQEAEAMTSAIYDQHYERMFEANRSGERFMARAGLVSPLLALRAWSMGIAGTDLHHFVDFQERAEAYRFGLVQALNEIHKNEIKLQNDRAQRIDRSRWRQFSPFVYTPPSLRATLARVGPAATALLAWGALMTVLAAWLTRRKGDSA